MSRELERFKLDKYLKCLNNGNQNTTHFTDISKQWKTPKKNNFVDCANEISEYIFSVKGDPNTVYTGETFQCSFNASI